MLFSAKQQRLLERLRKISKNRNKVMRERSIV
jgi:hypothetical protein